MLFSFSLPYTHAQEQPWESLEIVGKYINSDPPIQDKTFVAQYRVTGGDLLSIQGGQSQVTAIANTTQNGLFELKFPRSFPYSNDGWDGEGMVFLMINGYGANVYYLPETTPMLDHVRPKIINDIDRPPPHPETYDEMSDCYYEFKVPFYTYAKIDIVYGANGLIPSQYHGDKVSDDCIALTISDHKKSSYHYVMPPLKQEEMGVKLGQVVCAPEKILVWRTSDNSPLCVTLQTKSKLSERGLVKDSPLNSDMGPVKSFEITGRNYMVDKMVNPRTHNYEKGDLASTYSEKFLDGDKFANYYFQNVGNDYLLGGEVNFGIYTWGKGLDCMDRKLVVKGQDKSILSEQDFEKFCVESNDDGEQEGWYQRLALKPFLCTKPGLFTIHVVHDNKQTSSPLEAFSCIVR